MVGAVNAMGYRHGRAVHLANLSPAELASALRTRLAGVPKDDILLFHFAGHGFQAADHTLLLMQDGRSLFSLQQVLPGLRGAYTDRTVIAFIDACRIPPFDVTVHDREVLLVSDVLGIYGDEPVPKRLSALKEALPRADAMPEDTIVLFATLPGAVAVGRGMADALGSPFSSSLATRLHETQPISVVMHLVTDDVVRATAALPGGQVQRPFPEGALKRDLLLAGPPPGTVALTL